MTPATLVALLIVTLQQANNDVSPLALAIAALLVIVAMVGIAILSAKDNPTF